MATLAQRQLKQTRREMESDLKRRDREKLAHLRQSIADATRARQHRVKEVRGTCKTERQRFTERAKQARQRLRESIQRMRSKARELCAVNVQDAREKTGQAIAQAVAELQKESGYQASLKAWNRPTSCAVPTGRARSRELRSESDCEVAANIEDPGLRAVWERVKSKIKGSGRASRTEQFLQWAHDNSADVAAIQYEEEEKAVRELVKQEAKMRRAIERPDRYRKKTPEQLAELLADVPF